MRNLQKGSRGNIITYHSHTTRMRLFIAIEFPKGQKDPFNIKDMWFSVLFIIAIARLGKYAHIYTHTHTHT